MLLKLRVMGCPGPPGTCALGRGICTSGAVGRKWAGPRCGEQLQDLGTAKVVGEWVWEAAQRVGVCAASAFLGTSSCSRSG